MLINDAQLEKFIRDAGLVSQAELASARREAEKNGSRLGDALIAGGKVSEDDVRRAEAYVIGIPFVNLKNLKIDYDVLTLIPEPIARNHNIVSFKKDDHTLEVAMLDTDDLAAIDFIKKKTGLKILPRLTDDLSIKSALLLYQKSLRAEFGELIQKESAALATETPGVEPDARELKKIAEDLPVVRIVDTLLKHAIIQKASDIHIEPHESEVAIRYRIDGILRDAMTLPRAAAPSISARVKVLANLKLDEKRLPQDGRFKIVMEGEKVSLRVSILPVYFGEKIVMRLLHEGASGFSLEGLGFSGNALEKVHKALRQTTGMLLTTGPTGSGKTTTLYTMIDILNTIEVNISTIEDPIEYQIPRVNQTQVKPEIGLSFAQGLRTLVRQDPDIVMVGEIRDNETASLAINAALTGHLVLSTLHTNSAAGAVPRLLDMKVEPFLLVSTVNLVIAQRLVRKLSDQREKYFLTKAGLLALSKNIDMDKTLEFMIENRIVPKGTHWEKVSFWKPRTSETSGGPARHASLGDAGGYEGRIGIYEVMNVSPAIRELVMRGGITAEINEQACKEGMLTMLEDGIVKCAQGITTIEEVMRVVSE
jgi:type IV pilus assembly protein PilB